MEFAQLLRVRRMTRSFDGEPIDPSLVESVLAACLRAPSAGFTQGVDLLVLEGPEQTARYWDASLPPDRRAAFQWPGLLRAPLLVVVLASEAAYRRRYAEADKAGEGFDVPWWTVDAAFVAMLLQLAAIDAGLGALFFQAHRTEALRTALGFPATFLPIGTVAVGHPDAGRLSSSAAGRLRRGLDEVVHRGAW